VDLIQSEQPVEPEPRYISSPASSQATKTEHGQAWLRVIAGILIALILIVSIVFFARWVYQKTHNNSQTKGPETSQTTGDISSRNKTSESQLQGSGSTNPAGAADSSGSSTTSSGTVTPNDGNANSQISNTGPGNVAAVFVGTALISGGLHYIITIRRTTA